MGTLYKRGKKWHAEYTDWDGRRKQRSTGTANKSDAATILKKWEEDAALRRNGVMVSTELSLEQLIEEYLKYLGNSGDKHLDHTKARLNRIFAPNEWTRPAEINQYKVETTVRNLKVIGKKGEETERKLALRTQNHYLAAAKSFTKWLTIVRRALIVDPLAAVKKPSFENDRKLIRRFLLPEEWKWLAKTDNALLYETAIQTGFRSKELSHIGPENLRDDHIYLPGSATKNKKPAQQYVTAELRARLVDALPFVVPDEERLAVLLRSDLAKARAMYIQSLPGAEDEKIKAAKDFLLPKNAVGHVLDFHGLRHTCGAWLAIAGENIKVIQKVMRHSSISLTLDTYGHLLPGAEQDAVKHFAKIMSVETSQGPGTSSHLPDTDNATDSRGETRSRSGKTAQNTERTE